MKSQERLSFESFQGYFLQCLWPGWLANLMHCSPLSTIAAHELLHAALAALQQRWDTLRDEPEEVLWHIVRYKLMEWRLSAHTHELHPEHVHIEGAKDVRRSTISLLCWEEPFCDNLCPEMAIR